MDALEEYRRFTNALKARGERLVTVDNFHDYEKWTRHFAAKRNDAGELVPLPSTANSTWYYVKLAEHVNKLYIGVGATFKSSGKLNTGARQIIVEEGTPREQSIV